MGRDESQEYPEVVSFQGVGSASLLQIHIIAASVVALGVIFAVLAPPGGYIALIFFILLAAAYDLVFIRKSQKPVRVSLYLRTNPVEASYGERKIGEIKSGSIILEMENSNEVGFRPAPTKKVAVWIFDSEADAKIVAKRLLEYLPRER
ncbi:MAG: hypothetical protein OK439_02180 [Thaumarchaeota archaeon]|nr:hypothetical protein [Nitrososphaerota archaeon]